MAMHSASSMPGANKEIFDGATGGGSSSAPTSLGELLQHVPDGADRVVRGDSIRSSSLSSHVVELHEDTPSGRHPSEPPLGRPAHFVLAFTGLTYCVGMRRSFGFRRRRRSLATNPVTASAELQSVDGADGRKRALLNSVSGEVREGHMLAVMGASGSGKSTLIDALANRIAKESLKGSVTLNGEVLESSLLKVISAYVMQDDLLFPMLTVEETLTYAAEFRLPRALSPDKKRARVQALIDQLGLRAAAKTIIGDEGHRGVSGGERRRVSIGTDIIHDPILLLLDEPTSGLDSTSAFMVVKVLQRIARSGSIVIMSIHQPSYRIIGLLDRVMFLSKGQTVYSGLPNDLPAFFAEFGHPIANENWTEFALDVIRDLEGSQTSTRPLVEFNISWQRRHRTATEPVATSGVSLKDAIAASIARGKLVSGAEDGDNSGSASTLVPSYTNPLGVEVVVLTRRAFTNTLRMPELFLTRLGTVLVTGFILATIFWQLDDSPKGVEERLAFFAFACSTTFYTCADALPVFVQERYIFMRETAYNAYRRSSYVFANAVVSFPPLIFLSVAFSATTFFAVGLNGGASAFFFYVLIMLASFWAGSGFVTFLSGVISHVIMGYTIVVAVLAYFSLFCGFFINRDRIPVYWLWFHYISLVKYPYEAVMHNEFGGSTECFTRGLQIFDNTQLAGATEGTKLRVLKAISRTLKANLTSTSCMTRGSDVLRDSAVTQLGKWDNLLVTVAWGFVYRALFYFALQLGSRNKRR